MFLVFHTLEINYIFIVLCILEFVHCHFFDTFKVCNILELNVFSFFLEKKQLDFFGIALCY